MLSPIAIRVRIAMGDSYHTIAAIGDSYLDSYHTIAAIGDSYVVIAAAITADSYMIAIVES